MVHPNKHTRNTQRKRNGVGHVPTATLKQKKKAQRLGPMRYDEDAGKWVHDPTLLYTLCALKDEILDNWGKLVVLALMVGAGFVFHYMLYAVHH